jgi:hypothetical protein
MCGMARRRGGFFERKEHCFSGGKKIQDIKSCKNFLRDATKYADIIAR